MEPLTLRYNNPGAVEFKPWMSAYGATLGPNGRYAQFPGPEQGYQVMSRILDTYQNKHGLNNVAGIVNRWAPPQVDRNSTAQYIANVSRSLGVDPTSPLSPEQRPNLMRAMAAYEAGRAPASLGGAPQPPASSPPPQFTPSAGSSPMAQSFNGWTPESVQYGRGLGGQLVKQGVDTSPVQHWTQALARVLQAGSGAAWSQQANEGEQAGKQGVADIYRQGLSRGDGMNKIAAALMADPSGFGTEQGQKLGEQYMTTRANQGFQREQQDRQFAQQKDMAAIQNRYAMGQQGSSQAHATRMAELQHQLQLRMVQAKSEMERQQLLQKARALGLAPAEQAQAEPPAMVNGYYNNDPGMIEPPAPRQQIAPQMAPPSAPTGQTMMPSDPYVRLTTPAIAPEQAEADRKRRAGVSMIMGDEKGAAKILNKDEDPKEYQTKDALFAERMARAEIMLRGVIGTPDQQKYNPGRALNNFWPDTGMVANMTNSTAFRGFQGAAREWIAALLRKDTGAAVTQTEWDFYWPTFFPQPGDSAEIQKQKLQRRVMAAQGLRGSSGPAFDRMYPGFDQEMRGVIDAQPLPGQSRATRAAPQPGTVEDGFRFKGGDPSKADSWERVN